jgi:Domain of unknown function (DUF4218)
VLLFNSICSKVIDSKKLHNLQSDIMLTLCELKMYFSPLFFDMMILFISQIFKGMDKKKKKRKGKQQETPDDIIPIK